MFYWLNILYSYLTAFLLDAGFGIHDGSMNYSIYLGYRSSCSTDSECLTLCKDEAKDANNIKKSHMHEICWKLKEVLLLLWRDA